MSGRPATHSVCPVCLRRLPARVVQDGDEVWLRRVCPEHGETVALVWRGLPAYDAWRQAGATTSCCEPEENPACPTACGLCTGHARQSCCVLLEVTQRCDLECPVCFAAASREAPEDPSIGTIEGWYRRLLDVAPGCNVQLSGGEPTVRDDLPELIALGRSLGHGFLQLNTNGLRLAAEAGYAERLAEAGLSTVFLQFDGVDDEPYRALRGRPLAAVKQRAVLRCAEAGLGVVLVPTVARGVNLDRLGAILGFALDHASAVRGVHLQPLALLGRYAPDDEAGDRRVTLPDAMRALVEQSGGRLSLDDFTPGDCEHALCSFSREYLRGADGALAPLGAPGDGCDCGAPGPSRRPVLAPTDKAAHVAARWTAPRPAADATAAGCCCGGPPKGAGDQWDAIIRGIRANTFSVSGMAFMDAWTLDLDRLRHCYLHVLAADGRVVPFCAYNLTTAGGLGLPTGRHGSPAAGVRSPQAVTDGRPDGGARHRSGCMVCGAELRYLEVERTQRCHYCGEVLSAPAQCAAGHFVCDACHGAAAVEILERVCLGSRETDAVALMQAVRTHPSFPMNGPEHHSLVPAVILAALRNGGEPVTDAQIVAAMRRGGTVAGGACAYLGVCGAASGVGIAVSLLLGADPLNGEKRQAVQRATQRVLGAVAAFEAPRCCQRDSWVALREAAALLPESTGRTLKAPHQVVCDQWPANAECIRERCPLWPSRSSRPAGAPQSAVAAPAGLRGADV